MDHVVQDTERRAAARSGAVGRATEPGAMQRDEDVVPLRPQAAIELPMHETPTACAGAAASYVLRRIAYRAGAYAPGIQDAIFGELHAARHGAGIGNVERWFAQRGRALHALGYRIEHERSASSTRELAAWLAAGQGYRGAILATSYELLHAGGSLGDTVMHAVGFAIEGCEAGGEGALVTVDPWPRVVRRRGEPSRALELAHRARACAALAVHWTGWR